MRMRLVSAARGANSAPRVDEWAEASGAAPLDADEVAQRHPTIVEPTCLEGRLGRSRPGNRSPSVRRTQGVLSRGVVDAEYRPLLAPALQEIEAAGVLVDRLDVPSASA